MTPAQQHTLEQLNYHLAMADFDESRHLIEREKQYVDIQMKTPGGILVIKETEEGWWKESYAFSEKQMKKTLDDPTVVCGWFTSCRFNMRGGWDLD